MLTKMIKHDMRAMSKVAVPMFIASGIISVICCAMLYFTLSFFENADNLIAASALVGGFYVLGIMAIVVMSSIVYVMAIVRYYKSLFTDEGYLNMVLPMSTSTVLNAKILSTLIWSLISTAVIALVMFISVVLPTLLYNIEILTDTAEIFKYFMGLFIEPDHASSLTVFQSTNAAVKFVESTILTLTAINIGVTVMKKRRVLGAVLFYFAVNFVRENIISGFELIVDAVLVSGAGSVGVVISSIFSIVMSLALIVAGYLVSRYILTKKFNIE